MKFVYDTFSKTGCDRLVWRLKSRRLRILCYHGLCIDRLVDAPWVPDFFVSVSAFESHLRYLEKHTVVLPLADAVARLRDGSLPSRAVSITFDDGYGNNLELGYPLLRKYGVAATIFLSSSHMESHELFPFLKLKLIRYSLGSELSENEMPNYKNTPLDLVLNQVNRFWPDVSRRITEAQWRTLRPLTAAEVRSADADLLDFGAHNHTHCILRNETPDRRGSEIRTSIRTVASWVGRPVKMFSYPNGERGDFSEADKHVLLQEGIQVAVTGIGGSNGVRSDPLALRRYPVGRYHDQAGFAAEVTGFRAAVLALVRPIQ